MKKLFFIPLFLLFVSSAFTQSKLFRDGHWGFGGGIGINYFDGDLKPSFPGMLNSVLSSPSGSLEMEYYANHVFSVGLTFELNWLNESDENETTKIFLQNVYPYISVDMLSWLQGRANPKWNLNLMMGVGMGATLDSYYRQTQVYSDPDKLPEDKLLDPVYISENSKGTMIRDKDAAYALIRPGVGLEYKLDRNKQLGIKLWVNFTNSDKLETIPRSNMNDQVESLQVSYKYLIMSPTGKLADEVAQLKEENNSCCNELDAYRDQLKAVQDRMKRQEEEKKSLNERVEELEKKLQIDIDSDGDGVSDKSDKCPNVPGLISNFGCPEVNQDAKDVFAQAMKGIQFNINTAELKEISIPVLNNVVKVMLDNPSFNLHIYGHTSSDGDDDANLLLSEARAKSVMNYLVVNGVKVQRLDSKGYGETRPIEDNETNAGRVKNRRVEFEVWF